MVVVVVVVVPIAIPVGTFFTNDETMMRTK
jgi:hypothetical protein